MRWTHREGACCPIVCRLCSADWSGRENCREEWGYAKTHTYVHTHISIYICTYVCTYTPTYPPIAYLHLILKKGNNKNTTACKPAHTLHPLLTCSFPNGHAGLRGSLSLCRARSRSWRSNCSEEEHHKNGGAMLLSLKQSGLAKCLSDSTTIKHSISARSTERQYHQLEGPLQSASYIAYSAHGITGQYHITLLRLHIYEAATGEVTKWVNAVLQLPRFCS